MHEATRAGKPPLIPFIKQFAILEALRDGSNTGDRLENSLDLSTATIYRRTGRLTELGLVEESDRVFSLTTFGEVITSELTAFRTGVGRLEDDSGTTPAQLVDLLRYGPLLDALDEDSLDRRAIEDHLGISRSTSHRFTRALADSGLIRKSAGRYSLTGRGESIRETICTFENNSRTALDLAPILEALSDTYPGFDIERFSDATVTSAEHGDPYSPMTRFISLLNETETLRGLDTFSIAPGYMEEYQQHILDGMQTEVIDVPEASADVMENYPELCVEVCVSDNFELRLHNDLPFGLVILDDVVGVGVRRDSDRTVRTFVDTDAPDVWAWADGLYESYKEEAPRVEQFTKTGLREAMASL